MEDKNNTQQVSQNIILVAAVVVLLMVCFFNAFLHDKDDDSTDLLEPDPVSVSQTDEVYPDPVVRDLFYTFRLDGHYWARENQYQDNRAKLLLACTSLEAYKRAKKIECSKVGAKIGNSYCGNPYIDENTFNLNEEDLLYYIEQNLSTIAIESSVLKEKYEELFGTDAIYTPEDFGLFGYVPSAVFMHYDNTYDVYAYYSDMTDTRFKELFVEQIEKSFEEGDRLYIQSKVIQSNLSNRDITGETITYEFKRDEKLDQYVFVKIITNIVFD